MIGLDTNILARYYIEDQRDPESGRQREAAKRLLESGKPMLVCKTVLLELEWVMRGYYEFTPEQIALVIHHLLALPNVQVEGRDEVVAALANYARGLDLADAMHHAAYRECTSMASFDDRRFARRAKRLALIPSVVVPA